jgi:hypothetical protein
MCEQKTTAQQFADLDQLLQDMESNKPLDLVKHLKCTQKEADELRALAKRVVSEQQKQRPMTDEEIAAWAKRVVHLITEGDA